MRGHNAEHATVLVKAGAERQRTLWIHLATVLVVSTAWEWLFLDRGISLIDEGWPLYAAQHLHAGGTLYQDAFWMYPPGHVLPAWLGYAYQPPGIIATRVIYSALTVAACLALYQLGRALMPARFALAAALVVAVAAPRSHLGHIVFGYLYLVFSILALLAYQRRLRGGDRRWLVAAGLALGIGAIFRLEPAFAAGCGIGAAIAATSRPTRRWLGDWSALALGLVVSLGVAIVTFGIQAGFATLWREIVIRSWTIAVFHGGTPMPPIVPSLPWGRDALRDTFVALEFRLGWVLLALYLAGLTRAWVRARRDGRAFEQPLLLAVTIWATVYFTRTLGRSDELHLDSVLPPLCLLFVHAVSWTWRRLAAGLPRRGAERALVAALCAAWILLTGADLWLSEERRGRHPLQSTGGSIRVANESFAEKLDGTVASLRSLPPGVRFLDLSGSPMLHPLAGRLGPGGFDVIYPGTFLDPSEELQFIERLERSEPLVLLVPPERMQLEPRLQMAPLLREWVYEHRGKPVPVPDE